MAIVYDGAGGAFTKIGHIAGLVLDVNKFRGSSLTAPDTTPSVPTKVDTLVADYAAGLAQKSAVDGAYTQLTSFKSAQSGWLSYLRTLAQTTLIDLVDTDHKLASKTLSLAMRELIRQMTADSESVNASAPAAAAQTAVGTPTGSPVVVASVLDSKGLKLEYALAETLTITCLTDKHNGATAKQETFTVTGEAQESDTLSPLWPRGSGASSSISAANGDGSNAGNNLLYNSGFETFTTANYPDNWAITVGAAGTDIFAAGSGDAYTGSNALSFVGDGSTLIAITQEFDHAVSTSAGAGGTPAALVGNRPYALNCWIKAGDTLAAGVLTFSLVDGSGNVINDDAGTANTITKALTGVDTDWEAVNGVFCLPADLPDTIKLRVRTSTALANTKELFIDRMAMTAMTQLYAGGPYVAVFSSDTDPLIGDAWTIAISNTYGVIQREMQRLFDMRGLGLVLPSDASAGETIADSLVA